MYKTFANFLIVFLFSGSLVYAQNSTPVKGVNTVIEGTIDQAVKGSTFLYIQSGMMKQVASSTITKGRFKIETLLDKPGFYLFSFEKGSFIVYLNPGEQLTATYKNGQMLFSGQGSEINQLIYTNSLNFPYNKLKDSPNLIQTNWESYNKRLKAIDESKQPEVIKVKRLLSGYAQGEYLNTVYGRYIDSKVFGKEDVINDVNFTKTDIKLLPEIVNYYNWKETITELLFQKMKSGNLKVNSIVTWIADFANAIENEKLREDYIIASLKYCVLTGELANIEANIQSVLPIVKDPVNIEIINSLKPEISKKRERYTNALPGTNFSNYTFEKRDGKIVSLSDYKGKIIFIDIWNTACSPCIAEMPFLKKLEHDFAGKDVVFLTISVDTSKDIWKKFLDKRNMTGEQLLMTEGFKDPFFKQIGLSGIPRYLILDRKGCMIDYNCYKRPSNPLLKIYLNELLAL